MPATVNAGDLLLAFAAFDASATITTPSGWTLLLNGFRTDMATGIYAKVAAGNEDSTTVDFVTSSSQRGSVHTLRFTGWQGTIAAGIRITQMVGGTGGNELALAIGASADVHWVIAQAKSSATAWSGTDPASYGNVAKTNSSEDSTGSASLATATRANTAASELVPALWNALNTDGWLVAVMPSNLVAVTGTGALTLPFLEVAGSGDTTPVITGTGALTLPFLELSGTGVAGTAVTGSGALTLPFLEVAGTGVHGAIDGEGALTLPFLSVSGTGLLTVAPEEPDTGGGAGAGGGSLAMDFYNPAGTLIAGAVPQILGFTTKRGLNRVGAWEANIAISDPVVGSVPLASLITRGWRVNLMQANTHPLNRPDLEYLMYQGLVENKSYDIDESGVAVCRLTGSFRAIELANRLTPTAANYAAATMQAVAEDIVDDLVGGSITVPANGSRPISMEFNNEDGDGILGRYARLLKLGEQARWALRETWDGDTLEFIPIDGAPASGYTLLQQEMAGHGNSPGIALIGGTPELRREGSGIINRIIPIGSDIITELDLQSETSVLLAENRYGLTPTDPPLLTFATQPTPGKTFTFDGMTYTFVSGAATAAGQISVGANLAEAQANIQAAINGTDTHNPSNDHVYVGAFSGNVARIYPSTTGAESTTFSASGDYTDDAGNTFDTGDLGSATRTRNVPLTLEAATGTFPYEVVEGTNDDGTSYWYVEDETSIEAYGLVEAVMHRGDIKNPSDDSGTRAAAANVLYQFAWGELVKNKSPKIFVTVPIANGQYVWALPGDKIRMHYSGYVEVDGVVLLWEDIDKWFLVVERVDESTDSGVRAVKLTLAAPELDIQIDGLPEALGIADRASLPGDGNNDGNPEGEGGEGTETEYDPGDGSYPPDPFTLPIITPDYPDYAIPPLGVLPPGIGGNGGGGLFADCCEDPTSSVTSIGEPLEDPADTPLKWISASHSYVSGTLSGPTQTTVLIIVLVGFDSGTGYITPNLTGSNVIITNLHSEPGLQAFFDSQNYFIGSEVYLVEAAGEGSTSLSWTAAATPSVTRLTASKVIPNGVTVSKDTDLDTVAWTSPFSSVLSVAVSAPGVSDNKDAVVWYPAQGGAEFLSYSDNWDGAAWTPGQWAQTARHTLRIGAPGSVAVDSYFGWGGTPYVLQHNFLFVMMMNVRLNDE